MRYALLRRLPWRDDAGHRPRLRGQEGGTASGEDAPAAAGRAPCPRIWPWRSDANPLTPERPQIGRTRPAGGILPKSVAYVKSGRGRAGDVMRASQCRPWAIPGRSPVMAVVREGSISRAAWRGRSIAQAGWRRALAREGGLWGTSLAESGWRGHSLAQTAWRERAITKDGRWGRPPQVDKSARRASRTAGSSRRSRGYVRDRTGRVSASRAQNAR